MINRTGYEKEIAALTSITTGYQEEEFIKATENINHLKDYFDIKVLLVGHYNAGKTSLLNRLIGREAFRKVGQGAMTPIAAEYHYSSKESYYIVSNDGQRREIDTPDPENVEGISYVELLLNAENLKRVSDFTIVDTPGFLSGNDAHEKAVTSYLDKGSAFLYIVDEEDGELVASGISRLRELSEYSSQIALIINKCDLDTPDNVVRVKDKMERTLKGHRLDIPVYTVSARDENVADTLIDIINSFSAQAAFDCQMKLRIGTEASILLEMLKWIQSKQYLDTFEMDQLIHDFELGMKRINDAFTNEIQEAEVNVEREVESLVGDIRIALDGIAIDVASAVAATKTFSSAQAMITEAIRKSLYSSLKEFSCELVDDIVESVDMSFFSDSDSAEGLDTILLDIAGDMKNMIEMGSFDSIFQSHDQEMNAGNASDSGALQGLMIAARGITTTAAVMSGGTLEPLELIVVLLPEIIKLGKYLFGETEEQAIARKYRQAVIPEIIAKISQPLRETVLESNKNVIMTMQRILQEKLTAMAHQLEEKKKEKEDISGQFEQRQLQLAEDISVLAELAAYKED